MLSNKSVKIDRKHANEIVKEFGKPDNVGSQAEAYSKIVIEKQLGVKVEKGDDPPDLQFYQDGKCIGVEVTCSFEVVDLTKNRKKVSSRDIQSFLKGIAQKVQDSLIRDDSIVFPKDICFSISIPFPNEITFGNVKAWDDLRGEKKEIERELLKQIRDYFLDEDLGVCSGWIPRPEDPHFQRLKVVTNKGVNIPFEIDGNFSKEGENFSPVELGGSGSIGDSGIRESLQERLEDKARKKYGQKYDDLWFFVYDRWQENKGMAGIASAAIYGFREQSARSLRETKIALQEEFSQKNIEHHFSKIIVFNTLGNPNERDLVSINPIIVYDKDENIFDPRVFWNETKLFEMSITELKAILSKKEYREVKIQEHLEIIGDRLIDCLKDEKPIDVMSLKKLNAVARILLSRLEDFDDEDGFTSTFSDIMHSGIETPLVRWYVCWFILVSASKWLVLEKEATIEISKDDYLSIFSEMIREDSKNRQAALVVFYNHFEFIHHFDKVWAESNLTKV